MISIDWGNTYKILVPKSYLTLVGGTLYEMDVSQFRLDLKNLEDDLQGMPFPKTHNHNTEVSIAGVTYARLVEILSPYSVEFEDGAYSVRLVGANNNIFDVENGILVQNQVQVIANNSAGLTSVATPSEIAAAVWNTVLANHQTLGTAGEILETTKDQAHIAAINTQD